MKNNIRYFVLTLFYLLLQNIVVGKTIELIVANESDIKRFETISVSLEDIGTTNISNLIVKTEEGNSLCSQLIDTNSDGTSDVLIFQDSFLPKEKKKYLLSENKEKNQCEAKAFAMFVEGREDIAWESNKVAFRMYGPPLAAEVNNGIDVWAKRVDKLVVKKWYKDEEEGIKSYHVDGGEGADFFSVGKTLGCGGSAIFLNDSLYQSGVYSGYKIIENGPIRAIFELHYKFKINDKEILETKRISIDANSYLNRIETSYSEIPKEAEFVVGLVKRDGIKIETDFKNKIIAHWGNISEKKSDGELGIGALLCTKNNIKIVEDKNHLSLCTQLKNKTVPVYYSGAGWSRQIDKFNFKTWFKYLEEFKNRLRNPLVVKIIDNNRK